jgi:diaminohydroxyphosphoribosylaminopyrimidine deaminase/5-amino-6-(5-phosphoribosylamino)uracil reductase
MASKTPEHWMRRALELAELGEGKVSPNPLVGAVLVKNGKVAGEGFYRQPGGRHAEAVAIDSAGKDAEGSGLYINLEPCVAFPGKRTPPCTDKIIESGVKRVFIGMEDPNPDVRGKGIKQLKEAGIDVKVGLLGDEAEKLNEIYVKYMATGRPFILLKMAMTADGKIATRTGDSRWISSEESRSLVHKLRKRFSAVLVGIGTVLADDPSLTVRPAGGRNPIRIILDSKGRIPVSAGVLDGKARTIIVSADILPEKEQQLKLKGADVWKLKSKSGSVDLNALIEKLAEEKIDSVLIEGGGETAYSFLKEKLVDKLMLFIAPKIIGGREAKTPVEGAGIEKISDAIQLKDVSVRKISEDVVYEACL